MTVSVARVVIVVAVAAATASHAAEPAVPETFRAKASATTGPTTITTTATITINRYASSAEREEVMTALRAGGTPGLRQALAQLSDAGVLEIGERRTPIKFAADRATSGGRLITVVTAEPILFLGAGLHSPKAKDGFDVAVAIFEVIEEGGGLGDVSLAAKVRLDERGALVIDDYGPTVVWLTNITRVR